MMKRVAGKQNALSFLRQKPSIRTRVVLTGKANHLIMVVCECNGFKLCVCACSSVGIVDEEVGEFVEFNHSVSVTIELIEESREVPSINAHLQAH